MGKTLFQSRNYDFITLETESTIVHPEKLADDIITDYASVVLGKESVTTSKSDLISKEKVAPLTRAEALYRLEQILVDQSCTSTELIQSLKDALILNCLSPFSPPSTLSLSEEGSIVINNNCIFYGFIALAQHPDTKPEDIATILKMTQRIDELYELVRVNILPTYAGDQYGWTLKNGIQISQEELQGLCRTIIPGPLIEANINSAVIMGLLGRNEPLTMEMTDFFKQVRRRNLEILGWTENFKLLVTKTTVVLRKWIPRFSPKSEWNSPPSRTDNESRSLKDVIIGYITNLDSIYLKRSQALRASHR